MIRSLCCLTVAAFVGAAEAGESIAYRLADWKEMHFDDPGKADQHLAAVRKLGCEARLDSHGGHTDVIYRSAKWQSVEVATDELAHQWEAWLKGSGFETVHGHAEDHSGHDHGGAGHEGHDHADHDHAGHDHGPGEAEEVAYRLTEWRTEHFEDKNQLPEFVALMKGLGCEVRTDEHDGHADISIRCRQWKHVEFSSHKKATGWEGWLSKTGFEVRHEH